MRSSVLWCFLGVFAMAIEGEFILSYRAKMVNDFLEGEEYKVSRVLSPKGKQGLQNGDFEIVKTCKIVTEENAEGLSGLQNILKRNQDKILDCLYGGEVSVDDEVVTLNLQAKSKTILKIPPVRVVAIFEGGVLELNILDEVPK
ncbi:hypothetical protein BBW65_02305 [Helicobacter enhydrae]|uniref:Uncharacterized protein n=1 Tax=Helicobacter enhydrae TaxID=222136 RepID=A0A1B1U4J4_9HELI|nr:hypothetical protein BBW65_02305 [Helicobacter enhydrae]